MRDLLRPAFASLLIAAAIAAGGCARETATTRFSVENARAHVDMLAGTIGPRPAGSSNNAKARAYLIDQLRLYGFEVRVQETDAARAAFGETARIANIIAIKAGTRPEAIGLVAHYDSVPEAPGALDDGLGVAVCLEAGRVLAAQAGHAYSLMVILTDGEELGLMGAAAAVTDAEVKKRLRAYLNVEATGAAGQAFLFESGPRNVPLLEAWAAAAPQPRGAGFAMEIYKRLPNDTDFTIFRGQDIPGLNFAPIGDNYAYHTTRDRPERLQTATIRHTGESVVATAAALDRRDLTQRGGETNRYFDLASRRAFVYSPLWGRTLAIVAVLLAGVAWVRVLRHTAARGTLKLVLSLVWGLLVIAAAAGAILGAAWLLRASREVFHPWYAAPLRLLALLIVAGLTGGWTLTRLMHLLPEGLRSLRAPAAVWALTLPAWAAFAAASEYLAPAASHLWVVPLLAASVCLAAIPMRFVWLVRLASLGVAVICALLWIPDQVDLFAFMISLFGRLPIVTPIWMLPAVVTLAGGMVAAPLVAALTGVLSGTDSAPAALSTTSAGTSSGATSGSISDATSDAASDAISGTASGTAAAAIPGPATPASTRRRVGLFERGISALLLLGLAVTFALCYAADAYTDARPQRRGARYVHDVPLGQAWWEVGGNEPGLDLSLSADEAARWRPQTRPPADARSAPSPPLSPPLTLPFVFRAEAPPEPAPVDLAATFVSSATATDLEITIVPHLESLTATIVLPPGVEPSTTNLPGVRLGLTNRWRGTFMAMPMSGIAFRASVPVALAPKLSETIVIVSARRAPGAEGPRVPAWMPQARTEWTVQSRWIVQPPLRTPAPPAAPAAPAPAVPVPVEAPRQATAGG